MVSKCKRSTLAQSYFLTKIYINMNSIICNKKYLKAKSLQMMLLFFLI